MRHALALLPRLIAAVLLLQTVIAPAHCLAHAVSSGFATVICTEDGARTVHLTADGDMAPDAQHETGFCAACHGLPSAPHLAVPVLPTPVWSIATVAWHDGAAFTLPPGARAPPFQPTGPPTLS